MVFRLVLVAGAAGAWVLAVWFATHESAEPSVLGRYSTGYFVLVCGLFALAAVTSLAHLASIYRRLQRVKKPMSAITGSTLLALVAAEIGVRVCDPLGVSYYECSGRYQRDRLTDPELGFRHRPDFHADYCGVEYAFNELGLRDRPIGPKGPDELRVLVVGDSVTLGWGVAAEQTFCRRLEQLATSRLGRPVRLINSGVGGYNTVQELAFLRREGPALAPDVVLLVYVYNDFETHAHGFDPQWQQRLAGKSPPQVVQTLCGYSWLYRLLLHTRRHAGDAAPPGIDRDSSGWRESMAAVGAIAEWTQSRRLPFGMLFWRSLHDAPTDDALWHDLSALAGQRGFPLADSFEFFAGKDMRALTNSVIDSHPNASGHEFAASGMLEFLVGKGLLLPR